MSKLKQILGTIAPLAGLIPGIGLPLAAAIGAGGGLLSGGGLKGALAGGLGAASLGGGGGILGNALGIGTTAGSGLLGAAAGGVNGGLTGALLGGAGGALGGSYSTGDLDGILGDIGLGSLAKNASGTLGAGNVLTNGSNFTVGGNPGTLTNGTLAPVAGGAASSYSAAAGAPSGFGNALNAIGSGLIGTNTNDDAQKALLEQQKNSLGLITPYLNDKFEPGDLAADPGYQFQLSEGTKALDRTQAARGNYFSGQALTDATKFSQGLADTTANDAYSRWLSTRNSNLGAAGAAGNIYDNIGNVNANAITNNGNVLTGSLAGLLGGNGISNTGAQLGNGQDSNAILKRLLGYA